MTKEETAKLAELYKELNSRPYRMVGELEKLLKTINKYNQWKKPPKSKTLF